MSKIKCILKNKNENGEYDEYIVNEALKVVKLKNGSEEQIMNDESNILKIGSKKIHKTKKLWEGSQVSNIGVDISQLDINDNDLIEILFYFHDTNKENNEAEIQTPLKSTKFRIKKQNNCICVKLVEGYMGDKVFPLFYDEIIYINGFLKSNGHPLRITTYESGAHFILKLNYNIYAHILAIYKIY